MNCFWIANVLKLTVTLRIRSDATVVSGLYKNEPVKFMGIVVPWGTPEPNEICDWAMLPAKSMSSVCAEAAPLAVRPRTKRR
jgi:hypothetical protein